MYHNPAGGPVVMFMNLIPTDIAIHFQLGTPLYLAHTFQISLELRPSNSIYRTPFHSRDQCSRELLSLLRVYYAIVREWQKRVEQMY